MSYRIYVRMHPHQIRRQLIAHSEKKSLYAHAIYANSDDFSAEIAKKNRLPWTKLANGSPFERENQ